MNFKKKSQFNKENKEEKIEILKQEIKKLRKESQTKDARIAELIEEIKTMGIDKVTGLENRREHFLDEVSKVFHFKKTGVKKEKNDFRERKEGFKHASVVFCDIDNFKSFNDKFGHKTGDLILRRISDTLSENLRTDDRICRWGGEEIVIALMGNDLEESKRVAERLRQAVNNLTTQFKKEYRDYSDIDEVVISLSLGLCVLSADKELNFSVEEADAAMYVAKKSGGKNCVKVFSELDEKERQMAEKFLKKSEENN